LELPGKVLLHPGSEKQSKESEAEVKETGTKVPPLNIGAALALRMLEENWSSCSIVVKQECC
jgi:hypothetical protein